MYQSTDTEPTYLHFLKPEIHKCNRCGITSVPMHSNDTSSGTHKCTNAQQWHIMPHTNVPMRWQSNGCHIMHARSTPWLVPRGSKHCVVTVSENRQDSYLRISTISSNIRSLLHTLCTLSDHRWHAFFQNSLFTWSSFHVYGSLLSNQIEASNAHKN